MRGWFMGTCGPSTRSNHQLIVSQQNPEVSHACWNVRLHDTAETRVMQWSFMWGREDRPDLKAASLTPNHPWTPQPVQQTDIPSSQELCFHHGHCTAGLWQQFSVFPPIITTLIIVLYTNSILLPFTEPVMKVPRNQAGEGWFIKALTSKKRGLYTGRGSSTCPRCPGQLLKSW